MIKGNSNESALELMTKGSQALADVEGHGMKIDVEYLDSIIHKTGEKIKEMKHKLVGDPIYGEWRKIFGANTNLGSRIQLGRVIEDVMQIEDMEKTKKDNRIKTDGDALDGVDNPFVKTWVSLQKLQKLRTTNLMGVRNETTNGFLHPSFNLHLVKTFRSSSDSPNFQNLPIRDPKSAKLIRRAFIPRSKDHILVEIDFSGIEVCSATCYHQDPTMVEYIQTGHDLHFDMAMQIYKLKKDQVSKNTRREAKGSFVFPSFYGSWYHTMCQALWKNVDKENLTLTDGSSLRDHLNSIGMTELGNLNRKEGPRPGTFEHHVKTVEDDFWKKRFPVYDQWKKDWYADYITKGWYRLLTGFTVWGIYKKNEAINGPIQGTAFHWLLWSLTGINNWLNEKKMKTVVMGQIHDSIFLDIHKDEMDDVLPKCKQIMTEDIRKEWKWITVPLSIEAEGSAINWYEKQEILIA